MTPEETKNVATDGTEEETKTDDAKKAKDKDKTPKADNKDVPVYTVSQLYQMPYEEMKKVERLINAGKAKAVNDSL